MLTSLSRTQHSTMASNSSTHEISYAPLTPNSSMATTLRKESGASSAQTRPGDEASDKLTRPPTRGEAAAKPWISKKESIQRVLAARGVEMPDEHFAWSHINSGGVYWTKKLVKSIRKAVGREEKKEIKGKEQSAP